MISFTFLKFLVYSPKVIAQYCIPKFKMLSKKDIQNFGHLTKFISKFGSISFDWDRKKGKLTVKPSELTNWEQPSLESCNGVYWLHELFALYDEFNQPEKRYSENSLLLFWSLGYGWCFIASVNMSLKNYDMVWFFNQLLFLNNSWRKGLYVPISIS